jgi:hypothetical protein
MITLNWSEIRKVDKPPLFQHTCIKYSRYQAVMISIVSSKTLGLLMLIMLKDLGPYLVKIVVTNLLRGFPGF